MLTYSQELERRVVLGVGELFSVASKPHVRPSCLIYITQKWQKSPVESGIGTCSYSFYLCICMKYKEHDECQVSTLILRPLCPYALCYFSLLTYFDPFGHVSCHRSCQVDITCILINENHVDHRDPITYAWRKQIIIGMGGNNERMDGHSRPENLYSAYWFLPVTKWLLIGENVHKNGFIKNDIRKWPKYDCMGSIGSPH